MRAYLTLLGVWIALYFAPMFAGEWYEIHFNVYQAAISLVLILFALSVSRDWYIKSFSCICILHLVLNAADSAIYIPADNYNQIVSVFNLMEFILLFVIGGISQWRQYHDDYKHNHATDYGSAGRR